MFVHKCNFLQLSFKINAIFSATKTGSTTTDREQRRLAEKGDPKYIFTIPKAILSQSSLCDEITATKSCIKIIASRSVCRGQLTWLDKNLP